MAKKTSKPDEGKHWEVIKAALRKPWVPPKDDSKADKPAKA
jgi:hypothetical protein